MSFLIKFIVIFLLIKNAYAINAPCFNYEKFDHLNLTFANLNQPPPAVQPPIPFNQATANYNYAIIFPRNTAIPPLGPNMQNQIGISMMRRDDPPILWSHALIQVGGNLTLQQACMMALTRPQIGITTTFQNPAIIVFLSGMPQGAPLPQNFVNYATQALRNGGYLSPLSAAIFNFRNIIAPPNLSVLQGPGGAHLADWVILHFHIPTRVSKNIKELSVNSILDPALPNMPPYRSIKNIINAQYVGNLPPQSGTVISSDLLQGN